MSQGPGPDQPGGWTPPPPPGSQPPSGPPPGGPPPGYPPPPGQPQYGPPGGPPPGYPPPPGPGYPPPGQPQYGAPPPPGYGAPGPYGPPPGQGYAPPPPPRRGVPWWVWVLGGCGGCFAIVVIAGGLFVNRVSSEFKRPISEQEVKQALGPEVPIYPGSVFEPISTRAMKATLGVIGMGGQKGMFRGVGAYRTSDDSEKVFAWYDKELTGQGWQQRSGNQANQRIYQKGESDVILVQVQESSSTGGRLVVLMRGGPGLAQKMSK